MQLKNILKLSVMGTVLSLSAQASANLVENGSFEDLSSLPSWKKSSDGSTIKGKFVWVDGGYVNGWDTQKQGPKKAPIEIWGPNGYSWSGGPASAADGQHFVELNSKDGPFYLYQDIKTQVGQSYDFSFAYHGRTSRLESFTAWVLDGSKNTIKKWDFSGYVKNQWNQFNNSFIASSAISRIVFTSQNTFDPTHQPNNKGNFLDDIRVTATAVSEPATFALLGLGLLGAGITRKRAKA